MESSSGTYSGGEPVHRTLDKPLTDRIVQTFEELKNSEANTQGMQRMKGTGLFRVMEHPSGQIIAEFILARAEKLLEWNTFMHSLKNP